MMSICCSLSKLLPRDAGRVGTGPVFGRSVNPIPTTGADYAHHITSNPPDLWTVRRLLPLLTFYSNLRNRRRAGNKRRAWKI